ncbi:hypothetical protein RZS08_22545, partial [Arthrospira platensis SPKY1]|nr:hypothetical protein [Arthrospira platensis SPKY1]
PWLRADFASLLFYMGLLTIKESDFGLMVLRMPNQVINGLYYQFFQHILLQRAELTQDDLNIKERVAALARHNDMRPLAEALQIVLERLDNRDARGFNEQAVKVALMSLLVPANIYAVYSEHAIGQGYADVALFRRQPMLQPKRQHLIELKHLKKT